MPPSFRIGRSNREHVIVTPSGRASPEAIDYWEGNWVNASIEIAAGAFRGTIDAQLRAEDFLRFRDRIHPLYEDLAGHAKFESMEPWLSIEIDGDGKGHFRARCVAADQPGMGNRLTFDIDFDQTELPGIVRDLDAICAAIPVVGAPEVSRPR